MGGDRSCCPTPRGFTALKPMMRPNQTVVDLFIIAGWASWKCLLKKIRLDTGAWFNGVVGDAVHDVGTPGLVCGRGITPSPFIGLGSPGRSRRTDPLISGPWRGGRRRARQKAEDDRVSPLKRRGLHHMFGLGGWEGSTLVRGLSAGQDEK